MRRKRKNKQKKLILITSLSLLFILTVGYAAFQTNLNISAKGNILSTKITPSELKEKYCNQTSGDGLYKDHIETNRCIYKGKNPNNYITFNNETWRIISIEADNTLKIIKNESIGKMAWDNVENRNKATSTYCALASSYGCNAWAATTNLINTPSVFTTHYPNGNPNTNTTTYSGTVTQDSSLNTYLNTTYLGTINDDSKYIVNHNFNVGTPGDHTDTEDIATDVSQEALYKWKGKVGLVTITEVLKATTNTTCTSLKEGSDSRTTGYCNTNNWLWPDIGYFWTISPLVNSVRYSVWYVNSSGYVYGTAAYVATDYDVLPVIHLNANIILNGKGTQSQPYKIVS